MKEINQIEAFSQAQKEREEERTPQEYTVIQDGDLIGYVKELKNITKLMMFDYGANHHQAFKKGVLVFDSNKQKFKDLL